MGYKYNQWKFISCWTWYTIKSANFIHVYSLIFAHFNHPLPSLPFRIIPFAWFSYKLGRQKWLCYLLIGWHHTWCNLLPITKYQSIPHYWNINIHDHTTRNPMIRSDYDFLFKFILIGDSSNFLFYADVGKSCVLMRLLENRFKSQH